MTGEEMGDKAITMLQELEVKLEKKLSNKEQKTEPISRVKNSHLHIMMETSLLNKLRKEAEEKCISVAELCRQKLRDDTQLDRIEIKLNRTISLANQSYLKN